MLTVLHFTASSCLCASCDVVQTPALSALVILWQNLYGMLYYLASCGRLCATYFSPEMPAILELSLRHTNSYPRFFMTTDSDHVLPAGARFARHPQAHPIKGSSPTEEESVSQSPGCRCSTRAHTPCLVVVPAVASVLSLSTSAAAESARPEQQVKHDTGGLQGGY